MTEKLRTKALPQEWCGAHFIDDEEKKALERVIESKSLFRYYGEDLQEEVISFEREFAKYSGRKYALATASGTGALQVALGALGVGPGDEVLLPGYFWVATVGAVVRSGAVPVLVDCDESFSLDPDKIAAKVTERTKAIIVVHMGGVIGDIQKIIKVAEKHNIKVLEDCAQACGASQHGKKAGTFGDVAIFSFQLNKHMTAGEGGMLICDDPQLYRRAFAVHDLGFARDADGRLEFDDPETQLWGIGTRMSELTAAVCNVQLKKLKLITGNMRSAKNRIKAAIRDIKNITLRKVIDPAGDAGSFLMLSFEDTAKALDFNSQIRAMGITAAPGGMYPIHMNDWGLHIYYNIPSLVNKRGLSKISVWDMAENAGSKDVSYEKGTCKVLDSLVSRTVIICIASNLQDNDVEDIIKAIKQAKI